MNNLLLISLGLMLLVGWAISFSVVLEYSKFESTAIRYTQAALLMPLITILLWLLVQSAGLLYKSMIVWLALDPISAVASVGLILLATLISLPFYILLYFVWQYFLKGIDIRLQLE